MRPDLRVFADVRVFSNYRVRADACSAVDLREWRDDCGRMNSRSDRRLTQNQRGRFGESYFRLRAP